MKAPYPLLAFADRLAGTLRLLRERIRDAVATEVGLVAGQALQNVLHALIRGPGPRMEREELYHDDRDDEPYGADDPYGADSAEDPYDVPPPERPGLPGPIPLLAPAGFGARLVNLWLARRAPALATLGAGLLTGLLAWCGSPALVASLVATAAECLVLNRLAIPMS